MARARSFGNIRKLPSGRYQARYWRLGRADDRASAAHVGRCPNAQRSAWLLPGRTCGQPVSSHGLAQCRRTYGVTKAARIGALHDLTRQIPAPSTQPCTTEPNTPATEPSTSPANGATPSVGLAQIDSAHRDEHGALVVTVTGYEWGYRPGQGAYEARLADPIDMVVEVTATVLPSPDGLCEGVGFGHPLTVIGAANLDVDTIVDAFDESIIPVVDGIEQVRPAWFQRVAERAEHRCCAMIAFLRY